jgi:hypothetical protein
VQLGAGLRLHPGDDRDPGAAEPRRAAATDARVGIADAEDDAADAGGENRLGARRRAAMVVAGLERHEQGGAARPRPGLPEGLDFAVRGAGAAVIAPADDAAFGDDDRADAGIRGGAPERPAAELDGQAHVLGVGAHAGGVVP